MKKIIILCLLAFASLLPLMAQQTIMITDSISWSGKTNRIQTGPDAWVEVPHCVGCRYPADNNYLPHYGTIQPLGGMAELEFNLVEAEYEAADFDADEPLARSPLLEQPLQPDYNVIIEKKQPKAGILFPLLRRNSLTGELERLVSFKLEVTVVPDNRRMSGPVPNYASESVLNTGEWYKISVAQDGIFKMDYQFLKDLGIDVDNINPRNLAVYGNGGGMLPENNSEDWLDDLTENPIVVEGEADGMFNQGDYVLFYGQGPHRWQLEDTTNGLFRHTYNIYSEKTYYFVTVKNSPGNRVGAQASNGTPNQTATTFNDYAFHNLEETNLIRSGRLWVGNYFNFNQPSHTISFNFPNINTASEGYLRTRLWGRYTSSSSYDVRLNGQVVSTLNVTKYPQAAYSAYARKGESEISFNPGGANINVQIDLKTLAFGCEGWLDFLELNVRRNLQMNGSQQLMFRDVQTLGAGNVTEFKVGGANGNTRIWEVTNPVNPVEQQYTLNGSEASFVTATGELKEFVAWSTNGNFFTPEQEGAVPNQNLHGMAQQDMLIITHNSLKTPAEDLAAHHRTTKNLSVAVVTVDKIYNEFSSGAQDISAIRNFVRMFYDRAGTDTAQMPKYLLLFGDGSYDYKDITPDNTNLVPSYQSPESIEPISTFTTDDYFGCYDPGEGGSMVDKNDYLDIAIGRIPVNTVSDAEAVIAKIKNYESTNSYGSWRNVLTFIGDDEDSNTHLNQANGLGNNVANDNPVYNIDKIIFDAYQQQSTSGGSRYPDVQKAINDRMFSGTLTLSYAGHGGTKGWGHERVLTLNDINSWENFDKLPLFVTATCEFSKFDEIGTTSGGELVLFNPNGGGIGLVTTVRVVYSGANFTLSSAFYDRLFEPYNANRMPTMGEVLSMTKNDILQSATTENTRKFMLLGDPAVTLNYPRYDVVTTAINGVPYNQAADTLSALEKVTISGEVRDDGGNLMTGFNGIVYPTIYDKPSEITTLKNDPGSQKEEFELLENIIFKGRASVTNGQFEFEFIVPKDISYSFGEGKISYYAEDKSQPTDAHGYTDDVVVGGTADEYAEDGQGPDLDVYMNDINFVFGGTTDENPILLVKMFDFSGINTVGSGIGHDITGVLDEDVQNTIVLNEFYEAELNSYQSGEVRYPFSNLEEGRHKIKVKAWDVHNNSAEGYTEFVVASSADLALEHVLNYPNPFNRNTDFQFEHNRPGENLFVQIKIFTVTGKLIKTIQQDVLTEGYRVTNIHWNGRDDFGDNIANGVYVYQVSIRTPDGETADEFEKLVILR